MLEQKEQMIKENIRKNHKKVMIKSNYDESKYEKEGWEVER